MSSIALLPPVAPAAADRGRHFGLGAVALPDRVPPPLLRPAYDVLDGLQLLRGGNVGGLVILRLLVLVLPHPLPVFAFLVGVVCDFGT